MLLVIGDLIIDETYMVNVSKISPEAPTASASLLNTSSIRTPGGAGFAAAWAASQNIDVHLITAATNKNESLLSNYKIQVSNIVIPEINITKTRFIDKNSGYHILRLDNDNLVNPFSVKVDKVIEAVQKINNLDACLLSDYNKGFFNPSQHWNKLISFLKEKNIPIVLDTRTNNLQHWISSNGIIECWVKLNTKEFEIIKESTNLDIKIVLKQLLITKGSNGATLHYSNKSFHCEPSKNYPIPEVTGCGDIFDISFLDSLVIQDSPIRALEYAVNKASEFISVSLENKLRN